MAAKIQDDKSPNVVAIYPYYQYYIISQISVLKHFIKQVR